MEKQAPTASTTSIEDDPSTRDVAPTQDGAPTQDMTEDVASTPNVAPTHDVVAAQNIEAAQDVAPTQDGEQEKSNKYTYISQYRKGPHKGKWGVWLNVSSTEDASGSRKKEYFGQYDTQDLAARAQDRIHLKLRESNHFPSSNMNFPIPDYSEDEELRKKLEVGQFLELVKADGRCNSKKTEPSPCWKRFLAEEVAKGKLPKGPTNENVGDKRAYTEVLKDLMKSKDIVNRFGPPKCQREEEVTTSSSPRRSRRLKAMQSSMSRSLGISSSSSMAPPTTEAPPPEPNLEGAPRTLPSDDRIGLISKGKEKVDNESAPEPNRGSGSRILPSDEGINSSKGKEKVDDKSTIQKSEMQELDFDLNDLPTESFDLNQLPTESLSPELEIGINVDNASHAEAGPSHPDAGPSHTDICPSHAEAGPSHAEAGPSHPQAGPSNPEAGPSHAEAGPSHAEAGPSHPEAGPSHPEAGPSHPEAGPSHPEAVERTRFDFGHAQTFLSQVSRERSSKRPRSI